MIMFGLEEGFLNPLGHGLGSTTLAATKFGGDPNASSSEVDVSDMFISLGLIGGLIYLYIVFAAFRRAFAYTQVVSLTVSLPVLAILVSTVATWMIGGQYSTSSTVCFLIGALAHRRKIGNFGDFPGEYLQSFEGARRISQLPFHPTASS